MEADPSLDMTLPAAAPQPLPPLPFLPSTNEQGFLSQCLTQGAGKGLREKEQEGFSRPSVHMTGMENGSGGMRNGSKVVQLTSDL